LKASVLVLASCLSWGASWATAARAAPLAAFTRIEAEGDVVVHVTVTGRSGHAVEGAELSGGAGEGARATIADGVLEVRGVADDARRAATPAPVVRVTLPRLEGLGARGAAQIDVEGLQGGAFTVRARETPHITLHGAVDTLRLDLAGTTRLDADRLTAATLTAKLVGAARGSVKVSKAVEASLEGAARLTVSGKPAKVRKDVKGVASLVVR
jgi:hypothetical protein